MKELVTIITPDIEEHCREFFANHAEYADRNGYVYRCGHSLYWKDLPASFSKVAYIAGALENQENDIVIWADADVAFTRMNVDIGDLLQPDYWLAAYRQRNTDWIDNWLKAYRASGNEWTGDRPYICAGLMVIRNCEQSRSFFAELIRRVGTRVNTSHPFEQWYLDEMLVAMKFAGVRLCDTAEIGGFSREFWNDGSPWIPGCPTVHISNTDWASRRKVLVENYLPEIRRAQGES